MTRKGLFRTVFCSTPIALDSSFAGMDNFFGACRADYVFGRIDVPRFNGLHRTRQLQKRHPEKIAWVAKKGGYALSAFEEGVDAFLDLPGTEEKLAAVRRRLNWFATGSC